VEIQKGEQASGGKGLLAYAWFVWDKDYHAKPWIDWI
jgi:hypothetical protein